MKHFVIFLIFCCLSIFSYAGNLGLNSGFGPSVDFTTGNYVGQSDNSSQDNIQEESNKETIKEIAPNGPWMICSLKTEGNININKKTILKNIAAKKGELYFISAVSSDKDALMALGNFESVEIDISPYEGTSKNEADDEDEEIYPCTELTVIVKELPIFEKIIYEGRDNLSKGSIEKAMMLKTKDPFNESKLSADMARIKDAYAQEGYINAQVSYTYEIDEEKNIAIVTLKINEGERTRVKDVIVNGLKKIPVKKFIKQLENRPDKVYNEQKLPTDNYKATLYARNEGFYDFKINDYKTTFNEDKSEVIITYDVTEGLQVKFGDTTFNGNVVFTNAELEELVYYKKGKQFNQQKFDTTIRDIQEKYANKGYLRAEVIPELTPAPAGTEEEDNLNITFNIRENNIVYIDHIDITGEDATPKYIFAREIPLKEGDIFDYEKVQRGQNKLMNLGFLNDAQIDITPTNDINKVDLGYNIVEGRPGMFTAGVAMSSLDGLYGDVSINHMNLFHKAQRLSLRALFGSRILDYTISWSTPWIYEKPVSFGLDAFNTRRYRSYRTTYSAYTEKRIGGRINVGPRFNDDIYALNFSYSFENIDIYDIDDKYTKGEYAGELQEQKSNESTLGVSFTIDTRDSVFDPTKGAKNSLGIDLTGGPLFGDVDIYRITAKSSYNLTLINIGKDYPIVLMIANRIGMVKPYGRTDQVPAYERIFLGGADTVRGYDTDGQVGQQKGGEIYYVGNVELKFPIAREGRRTLAQIATFFDIGSSWNNPSDIRLKTGTGENDLKMGVGFGLRLVTPTLPIRLDWGYGLNHKSGEKRGYVYFSMANLF